MKKLVLFFAVATAVAFASCGSKEKAVEETTEEAVPAPAPVEVVVDSVAADTTVAAPAV